MKEGLSWTWTQKQKATDPALTVELGGDKAKPWGELTNAQRASIIQHWPRENQAPANVDVELTPQGNIASINIRP